jgi:hypothetical protein
MKRGLPFDYFSKTKINTLFFTPHSAACRQRRICAIEENDLQPFCGGANTEKAQTRRWFFVWERLLSRHGRDFGDLEPRRHDQVLLHSA